MGILDSRFYYPVLGLMMAGALGYSWWSGDVAKREAAAAQAVTILPPGVQQQWEAYVDRRLALAIKPLNSQLQLVQPFDAELGRITTVAMNTPFSVDCNMLGASVDFATGGDGISVPIYGLLVFGDDANPPPAMGVSETSVAAEKLYASLCPRVVSYMGAVVP